MSAALPHSPVGLPCRYRRMFEREQRCCAIAGITRMFNRITGRTVTLYTMENGDVVHSDQACFDFAGTGQGQEKGIPAPRTQLGRLSLAAELS